MRETFFQLMDRDITYFGKQWKVFDEISRDESYSIEHHT